MEKIPLTYDHALTEWTQSGGGERQANSKLSYIQ